MTDLERAYNALNAKLGNYKKLFAYADGNQELVYSTERLKEAFGNLTARFNQNWCAVVLNSTLDRLVLKGFDPANRQVNDQLDNLWSHLHLSLDAYQVHRDALITSEGYIIAWKGEDGLDVYHNDPRLCHLFYSLDRPKVKEFAAKWYVGADEKYHMTLYYTDRLEYYVAKTKATPSSARAFEVEKEPVENPYKEIPVFRFYCEGELFNIITLQDAINKLCADMMVAAEYGAFRQRWVITNATTDGLKNGPNMIWEIPAGDGIGQATSVGEFQETGLGNYIDSMDKLANTIAVISRTPKHYLTAVGGNISGDALMAMEAPLVKKVEQRQESFGVTWQELAAFLLKLEGEIVNENELLPVWEPAESDQPITDAQSTQYQVQAGIPLETVLRRKGWGKSEILQMRDDAEEVKKRESEVAKALLDKLRLENEAVNLGSRSTTDNTDNTDIGRSSAAPLQGKNNEL
jgi:hypothetical protein